MTYIRVTCLASTSEVVGSNPVHPHHTMCFEKCVMKHENGGKEEAQNGAGGPQ